MQKIDLITKEAETILSKADLIQTIQFDHVIIAIGAKNEYFGVKGQERISFLLGL